MARDVIESPIAFRFEASKKSHGLRPYIAVTRHTGCNASNDSRFESHPILSGSQAAILHNASFAGHGSEPPE